MKKNFISNYYACKKQPIVEYFFPFSSYTIPKYIKNKEAIVVSNELSEVYFSDNKWCYDIDKNIIWTFPSKETAPPLEFLWEVEPGDYNVFVEIPCLKDFMGVPLSSVVVTIGKQKTSIEKIDCEEISFYLMYSAAINLEGKKEIEIKIEPGNKKIMCALQSFRIIKNDSNKGLYGENTLKKEITIPPLDKKIQTVNTSELPSDERLQQLRNIGYF